MDQILKKYNASIGDMKEMKKTVKRKLEASQKEKPKPTFEHQEDGWITVHRKGARENKQIKKKKKKNKDDKKLLHFYDFEVKMSKLEQHKQLLEKFEADKKRLAEMKKRGFFEKALTK